MDVDELAATYLGLRTAVTELGLEWLLTELDEGTAIGIVEIKPLRQQTRKGHTTYEELTESERAGPGRRRAEEFLSNRPMSLLEQVDALLDALVRVLVDLGEVADAAVAQLNDLPTEAGSDDEPSMARRSTRLESPRQGGASTLVSEISFEPDEGSAQPRVDSAVLRETALQRDGILGAVEAIRRVVHA